jgi:uncharacterized membrane protein (UPF0127 family)
MAVTTRRNEASWRLVVDGRRLDVPVEVAATPWRRLCGALGRTRIEGGLLLQPCSSVHGWGMRIALDVAYLAGDGTVLDVAHLPRGGVHLPRRRARAVLETDVGRLREWGVRPGVVVTVAAADVRPGSDVPVTG